MKRKVASEQALSLFESAYTQFVAAQPEQRLEAARAVYNASLHVVPLVRLVRFVKGLIRRQQIASWLEMQRVTQEAGMKPWIQALAERDDVQACLDQADSPALAYSDGWKRWLSLLMDLGEAETLKALYAHHPEAVSSFFKSKEGAEAWIMGVVHQVRPWGADRTVRMLEAVLSCGLEEAKAFEFKDINGIEREGSMMHLLCARLNAQDPQERSVLCRMIERLPDASFDPQIMWLLCQVTVQEAHEEGVPLLVFWEDTLCCMLEHGFLVRGRAIPEAQHEDWLHCALSLQMASVLRLLLEEMHLVIPEHQHHSWLWHALNTGNLPLQILMLHHCPAAGFEPEAQAQLLAESLWVALKNTSWSPEACDTLAQHFKTWCGLGAADLRTLLLLQLSDMEEEHMAHNPTPEAQRTFQETLVFLKSLLEGHGFVDQGTFSRRFKQ